MQQYISRETSPICHNQIEEDIEQHNTPTDAEAVMDSATFPFTLEEWSPETPAVSSKESKPMQIDDNTKGPAVWGERAGREGGPRKGRKK